MKLSIVVNMYNTAVYMPKCLDTLLHQDIPQNEYEIILVDDCSTDNSLAMAYEFAEKYNSKFAGEGMNGLKDERIHVIHHETNKGLAAARNTGIGAAKGEYLCFVDPDDYIEKNSLAALLKQMDEEQLDMLRFNYQKVDEQYNNLPDSEIEARFDYTPKIMTGTEFLAHRLGIGCYVWAYIYRLEFIKKTGIRFFEGCFFDDAPWLPRILQKAQRINVTPVRHQYYLQRSTSMVRASNKQAIIRRADMHMQLIDILKEQRTEASEVTYEWYDMMSAHAAISMLTGVATIGYALSLDYYKRLREKKNFPLSTARASKKSLRKIKMLNRLPRLTLLSIYLSIYLKNMLK